jgi:23S rRNA (cytidine1920-2'-O)/16S rRNA (cytidine1409-2'-O)-methyltransferase
MRLDVKLVKMNMATSREKAKELILSGSVLVAGEVVCKPDFRVGDDELINIDVKSASPCYASRGAFKIMWAAQEFRVSFYGKQILDLGSSTGGFTDFALQKGAKNVICVDVGYGLLDWKLRNDPRVFVMERTNARYLKPEDVPYLAEIVMGDLSFISLKLIISSAARCSKEDAILIFLVKPQFEVGRSKVERGGIVKDEAAVKDSILTICKTLSDNHIDFIDITFSPIKNRRGNVEYFIHAGKGGLPVMTEEIDKKIDEIIVRAKNFFEEEARN